MEILLQQLFTILTNQTYLNPLPFNEGCDESQIVEAEQLWNLELPEDYKAFLRYRNGQSDFSTLAFPPDQIFFLSLEEVVELWEELNQYPDDQFFDQFDADGKIRSVLQHPRRIPIAYNEAGGTYLFIDYIPGSNGREKQLVFNINEVDCVVIADNFYNLIQNYVHLLERGRMVVKEQPPEYGQGYWFVSTQDEFIDWNVYERLKEV